MVVGGGVWGVYPHCRVYSAVEGNGAGSAVSVAEPRPWPRGTSLKARVLAVEKNNWLGGTTLEALVPAAGTTLWGLSPDGVRARRLLTAAVCAALLDRLAPGTRAYSGTKRGVPDSVVDGAVPPSSCQLPVRNVRGWRA